MQYNAGVKCTPKLPPAQPTSSWFYGTKLMILRPSKLLWKKGLKHPRYFINFWYLRKKGLSQSYNDIGGSLHFHIMAACFCLFFPISYYLLFPPDPSILTLEENPNFPPKKLGQTSTFSPLIPFSLLRIIFCSIIKTCQKGDKLVNFHLQDFSLFLFYFPKR